MTMVTPPDPQLMKEVPESFRAGQPAPYSKARAYTDGLGPGNVTADDIGGCYAYNFSGGLMCAYNMVCNRDCVCHIPIFLGIPTALCFICLCLCERDGNSWVMRDKNGFKTGEVLLVDKERRTWACYSLKCCSKEFKEKADCYADPCCEGKSVPVR